MSAPGRFVFFYLMTSDGEAIRNAVPAHVAYWSELRLANYIGGPFADRSGGLITFKADSEQAAKAIVERDPFMVQRLVASHWVKEWRPE